MLSLTVLGGSAAWPNPGQGCSSYLARTSERSLLLDCGADTLLELRRHVSLSDVDGILISHCHADHILDLVTFRYALVYGIDRADVRIPVWLPPGGIPILRALGDALGSQGEKSGDFWGEVFDVEEYDPRAGLNVLGIRISFARTQHFTPCYAMRLTAPGGKTLVYGADTGQIDNLIDFAASADMLISEATADDNDDVPIDERGHLTPEDAGRWARLSSVKRLVLSHLWHERASEQVVARAATQFSGPIDIASRGLKVYV